MRPKKLWNGARYFFGRRCSLFLMALVFIYFSLVYLMQSGHNHFTIDHEINDYIPQIPDEMIKSLSENDMLKVERRMMLRKKMLTEKCLQHKLDILQGPNPWEFLVNAKHHIIWCNVFKAASTSWLYNFNILAGYKPEILRNKTAVPVYLARKHYPRVTLEQLRRAQNNSVTFLIVRHPFERLLSAYRNMFIHNLNNMFAQEIVSIYRRKSLRGKLPFYPTFAEFVRWFLDEIRENRENIDMHIVAYTDFCTPCSIKIDLILKTETLDEDQIYLIEKVGLKRLIAVEWRNNAHGNAIVLLIKQYYSQLSTAELHGLYNYYRYDFELFNYSAKSYFDLLDSNGSEVLSQFTIKRKRTQP